MEATATLSKSAVTRATEIASNTQKNAVIIEMMIGEELTQMAMSQHDYDNRMIKNIEVIATIDPSGVIL